MSKRVKQIVTTPRNKWVWLAMVLLCAVLLTPRPNTAEAAAVGDIAVIGFNAVASGGSDDFAFVVLSDLTAGEEFIFTDAGANAAGGFAPNTSADGGIRWTVPAGGTPAGTVIRLTSTDFAGRFTDVLSGGGTLTITVAGADLSEFSAANDPLHTTSPFTSRFSITTSGDQILIYQGPAVSPTFLHGLHYRSNATDWNQSETGTDTSDIPNGLTNGVSAVAVGSGPNNGDESNLARYTGPTTGNAATIFAAINDTANWEKVVGFSSQFGDGGVDITNGVGTGPGAFNVAPTSTPPTISDANISISGATGTGGAFKVGDTVTASWDNTASGDNNSDIVTVTVDFSAFGGGAAVLASNSGGTWRATYTIIPGSIDATNLNVAVTAENSASDMATTADTTNATVDNQPPTVTAANISLSGASGTGGAFIVGDTVTASWDNTAGGDNNSDTINSVTVDFSAFGGGAAVAASNSGGTWRATYTIIPGSIDATNLNVAVTVADDAGNSTTTADTTNATVDNQSPTVTAANISLSGASGTGGAFKVGDTVTASWDNTAGGDNNSDTISSVTVDFSAFGGGAAVAASNSGGTWRATYTITSGSLDATNLNVVVTAIDDAGIGTITADTTNATVDNQPPTVTAANISLSGASGTGGAFVLGDTVTASWDNTAGGDNNSDTINSVTVDFSAFGGGAAVAASNSGGTWSATLILGSGSIDATNLNVAVTATDDAGNTTITADDTNATVDDQSPTVSAANISLSGASGTGGAFVLGDTVTASWDNTAGGDNNGDIATVTVDFSAFGGGAAVAASNSGDTWSATYTIVAGSLDATNLNVAVTANDDAGNTTITSDDANATVDNQPPTVTAANISLSGASGTGGAFIVGDTITATWNNTAGGDNNGDIATVTVDFSAFDGGAAVAASENNGTWSATYTITSGTIDATNLNVTVTATDDAGNTTTTADTSNATVDNQIPSVTAFARNTPITQTTNADTLTFDITFSENVSNIDETDFVVSGLTGVNTVLAGSGSAYTLVIDGGDLASANGTVELNLASDQDITDAAGNPLTQSEPATDESYILDNTPPSVTAFARNTPLTQTTDADTLIFAITFSEDVINVDATDFDVIGTTADKVLVGSGASYTLTVSGGDLAGLNGDVSLNLADGQDIVDQVDQPLTQSEPATDETYTLLNPVTEVSLNAGVLTVADITGLANSFTLQLDAGATPNEYVLSDPGNPIGFGAGISGGVGEGTDTVHIPVTDVSAITFQAVEQVTTSGAVDLHDGLTTDGNLTLDAAGAITLNAAGQILVMGPGRTVNLGGTLIVDDTGFDSTIGETLTLVDVPSDATVNGAFTALAEGALLQLNDIDYVLSYQGGDGNDVTLTMETTPPAVSSIMRADNNPTSATTVRFTVTFSELVTGVTAGDFVIDATGVMSAAVTDVSGSGDTYTLTVNTGTGDGSLSIDFDADADGGVTDNAGNVSTADFTDGEAYTVEKTSPFVSTILRGTPLSEITNADMVTFAITFSEAVFNVDATDFVISGTTATGVLSGTGSVYSFTVSGGDLADLNGVVTVSLNAGSDIVDAADNTLLMMNPSANESYTLDNTAPSALSFTRSNPISQTTAADVLVFAITFSEEMAEVDAADFEIIGTTATGEISGSGAVYTLTVSGGDLADLNGVVALNLVSPPTVTDVAGNALSAGEPTTDESYLLEQIYELTVTIATVDGGTGIVTSNPGAIDCGTACVDEFANDTMVTLTATVGANSLFVGWTGAVESTETSVMVTMDQAKAITATFETDTYYLFLPAVSKPAFADLVVESLTVTGDNSIELVIRNDGSAAVTNEFWVDVYIGLNDPTQIPSGVNDIWNSFSPNGAVWGVTGGALPLNPGQTLTLTVGDGYYRAADSRLPDVIPSGTVMYAQVDSADANSATGAVLETHEVYGGTYNNVFGPVIR